MRGYWADEARTPRRSRDGWMHTGDLATLDAEGYCNIVGRIKDMVIRGGENVYPREIEEFLTATRRSRTCRWSACRTTATARSLRLGPAAPGATANEDEIKAFCRDQIAHYKVPRYVRFVDELPMTVTGKIQKYIMREQMISELGLKVAKTA